ncbi:MAG: tyrosine-type recombinase/integrase, partial [Bacteroidales bacterium]|nr:tyrosine-type recombinase/integrase [Bacteroidales bacterium]
MKRINYKNWNPSDFASYLRLELALSENTISSYCSDVEKMFSYISYTADGKEVKSRETEIKTEDITTEILTKFIEDQMNKKISKRTQARIISSLKSYFRFLENNGSLSVNPAEKLDSPKIKPHLPDVLSVEEIEKIISSVDLSLPEGHRNMAIIEMLYSCGLRVSELTSLRISDLFFPEGFIRVIGKGNKQRLIPVGEPAVRAVGLYMGQRVLQKSVK